MALGPTCFVRRIWAHKISFFVHRPQDRFSIGSGFTQDCSALLTLTRMLRGSIHNHFSFSRASLELALYIKMATLVPVFRKTMVSPSLSFYLDILHLLRYARLAENSTRDGQTPLATSSSNPSFYRAGDSAGEPVGPSDFTAELSPSVCLPCNHQCRAAQATMDLSKRGDTSRLHYRGSPSVMYLKPE